MFQIDIMSRKAVYEQLVDQIERYILMGILKPDEQIPSVRSMSTQLSVNPNTIQKAYSELDRRGVVYSVSGRGCFVSPAAREKIGERKRQQLVELQAKIRELALAGIGREEILACVDEIYGGEGGKREGQSSGMEQEERQPEGRQPDKALTGEDAEEKTTGGDTAGGETTDRGLWGRRNDR